MPKLDELDLRSEDAEILRKAFMPNGKRRATNEAIAEEFDITLSQASQRVRNACRRAYEKLLERSLQKPKDQIFVTPGTQDVQPANERKYWSRRAGDEFDTLDLVFAAALMARGAEYLGLREPDYLTGHQPSYRLRVGDELLNTCRKERERGDLLVDAGTFWDRIRIVKDAKYQWHTFRDTGRMVK